jgi:hypothetical protein
VHQRTKIRNAVVARLVNRTDAGQRVFPSRVTSLRRVKDLPAISVYMLTEDVDAESLNTAPRELTRQSPLIIEAWVNPGDDPDVAMDDLSEQIETAMHADPYFFDGPRFAANGITPIDPAPLPLVSESYLTATEMELLEMGDRLMGFLAMTYLVTYRTLAPEADLGLVDFLRVEADHKLGDVHDAEHALDEFTVQTP